MKRLLLLCAAPIALGACAHTNDDFERQLADLRMQIAEMETGLSDSARGPHAAALDSDFSPMPGVPAGPPALEPVPNRGAVPALRVVRLKPIQTDPFADGTEPTIRIGKSGRVAPPVKAVKPKGPLEYRRVDEFGNLVDTMGRILYRAGEDSPEVDTIDDSESGPEDEWELAHESPAERAARATGVPTVEGVLDSKTEYAAPRMADILPAGVRRIAPKRIRQLVIGDSGLPDDRSDDIRVDVSPAPDYLAPAIGASARDAEPLVRVRPPTGFAAEAPPAVRVTPIYQPVIDTAPPALPTVKAPNPLPPLPGPGVKVAHSRPVIVTQVRYKGRKERKAQTLYKNSLEALHGDKLVEAEKGFETFLRRYHDHDLADNALYWLGEASYARGEWAPAQRLFEDVMFRYPTGNKLPDAMVKSALCYARLGDTSHAVTLLSEVETLFEAQPVAKVARQRREALVGDN